MILFHGDSDATVNPRNADQLLHQWAVARGPDAPGKNAPPVTVQQGQAIGGRKYTCTAYHDASGKDIVEHWTIHGAGHAWSGGSPNGTFTDPGGPDASRQLVRFFRAHPLSTTPTPRDS